MTAPTRHVLRTILLAASVALVPMALADHYKDDASSGRDAGNTKDAAMAVPYGTHQGYLDPRDHDWFRVDAPAPTARCVQVKASGDNDDTVGLTIDSADRTRALKGRFPTGGSKTLALAVPHMQRAYFDITASANEPGSGDPARPGHYQFTMSYVDAPAAAAGDALTGTDAGNSFDKATPLSGACTGGSVTPLRFLGDRTDVYKLDAVAGTAMYYSFAATTVDALSLTLHDASGNVVNDALKSGQYDYFAFQTSGTYYLSASSLSLNTDDVGYLIGVIIGPPDPGEGCRPQC